MLPSATAYTLPPRPPSPPSGPPRGTYFSRRKLTTPFPPLPAWISITASSMNFIQIKKPYRVDRAFVGVMRMLGRHHAHGLPAARALHPEGHLAAHFREQCMVLAHADVVAGVDA